MNIPKGWQWHKYKKNTVVIFVGVDFVRIAFVVAPISNIRNTATNTLKVQIIDSTNHEVVFSENTKILTL